MESKIKGEIKLKDRAMKGFAALAFAVFFFVSSPSMILADDFSTATNSFFSLKNISHGLTELYKLIEPGSGSNNLNNRKDDLVLMGVRYRNHVVEGADSVQYALDQASNDADVEAKVVKKPLVYPNPFRQSTTTGGELHYSLSKDMNIEIHVYNMLAQRVFKQTFLSGANGASKGDNKLIVNNESFGGSNLLSAGVYFFVLIHEGKVLSKCKVAVKP